MRCLGHVPILHCTNTPIHFKIEVASLDRANEVPGERIYSKFVFFVISLGLATAVEKFGVGILLLKYLLVCNPG